MDQENSRNFEDETINFDDSPSGEEESFEEERPSGSRANASRANAPRRNSAPRSSGGGKKTASSNSKKGKTAGNGKKEKKAAVDLSVPKSAKALHQVLPYVFIVAAAFIGITLILNLFCNPGNKLADNPDAHWMGSAGYHLCHFLYGSFGPAVLALPLLLLNLAFFWKKYVDRGLAVSKIAASALFLILLSSTVHIFCLLWFDEGSRWFSGERLYNEFGAAMTGGGFIGGMIGYFFVRFFNVLGSVLISILLLAASLFYFLGMTPQYVMERIKMRKLVRKDHTPSVSEQDAEAAKNKARMDEKIRKTTSTALTVQDENDLRETGTAVQVVEPGRRAKNPEDKLAPMPMPTLDPDDGTKPFVPYDVNQKMKEAGNGKEEEKTSVAPAPGSLPQKEPAPAPRTPATPAAAPTVAPTAAPTVAHTTVQTAAPTAAAKPAEPAVRPVSPATPAQNRDGAVDPIFPKSNEAKPHKLPKEERNFDLKNVFIDFDEPAERPQAQEKKHAPIPPEVPPVVSARPPEQPAKAPAPAAKPMPGTIPASPAGKTPASPAGAAKPAAKPGEPAQKPVFRPADPTAKKDFGLSDEEFAAKEAAQINLPSPGKKPAPAGSAKPAPAAKAPAPKAPAPVPPKPYVFPPVTYLHPVEPMTAENLAEIEENMNKLAEKLGDFRIGVKEINYSCGPTVTRYEVTPAPGVRVSSIENLSKDIAMTFGQQYIRMEVPIPGKNAVGIEVPNQSRCNVYLRQLIENDQFTSSKSKLTSCLGADITGQGLYFDISKMPHLLIAGTTGSGKSVCINTIIMSLLFKARPDEVKLVLIDPKKVEFTPYKGLPHLLAPIVTTPKDAAGALQAGVEEMESRFELIQQVGVHDIKGYNEATKNDPDMPFLPYFVIIIDELADLMMTAPDEVETAICRIAQKGRAAGVHLIIGTQRPSVDVVTGLIKANVPSRIAFTVRSQVDSRTILDYAGADKLAGKGDMLFSPVGALGLTRVQGAFVDDKEVEKICEFIRATNGTAVYDEKFTSKMKELASQCANKGKGGGDVVPSSDGDGGGKDDPKYADAVKIAIEEKRISTSLLQRKLEVGYSRAAKLIDRMQADGFVSPPDGSKPRSILITPEQYLEKFVDGEIGDEESSSEE